jgi:hypothetical protein
MGITQGMSLQVRGGNAFSSGVFGLMIGKRAMGLEPTTFSLGS